MSVEEAIGSIASGPNDTMSRAVAPITRLRVSAYTIPTDAPESDGTLEWNATTLVLVEASAGGVTGIGYSYANRATAVLIADTLAGVIEGRDAFDVGIGAFGTARVQGTAPCVGVVQARALAGGLERAPLLAPIGTLTGGEAQIVALSPEPTARHLYLIANGSLHAFRRSATAGTLEPIQQLAQGVNGIRGLELPYFAELTRDGRHLFVANAGDGTIITYRINDDGTLASVATDPAPGAVDVATFGVLWQF